MEPFLSRCIASRRVGRSIPSLLSTRLASSQHSRHIRNEAFTNRISTLPTKSSSLPIQRLFSTCRAFRNASLTAPPSAALESTISAAHRSTKSSSFPDKSSKAVGYWLLASAASVFGIVIWGGLTRLTESGLSITEWRPITGSMPPSTDADWDSEFEKYRSSPEYAVLNPNMTLDEFKKIYFMEWSHRLWGRVIGMTTVLPTIYFIARRKVSTRMAFGLVGISALIGFQGVLGWWMVKSGLHDDLFAPGSHPRVSQYRLTAHLGAAFVVYLSMLWSGLSILQSHKPRSLKTLARLSSPRLALFRRLVLACGGLVFLTAMSGGLVAGLDAGLIYNEFPSMSGGLSEFRLTPPKSELLNSFYSRVADQSDLLWRNMLENPSLVQLDHRILATSSLTAIISLFIYGRRMVGKPALTKVAGKGLHGVLGFVGLQVALGITTLLYLVPVPLAAAHQATSLALLSYILLLSRRITVPQHLVKAWKGVQLKNGRTSSGFQQWYRNVQTLDQK